jgi:DNA topoisomerase-3
VARDISKVLGRFQNRDGYLENDRYIVSWALGHLLELAEPECYDPAFKKWSLDVLPIVPAKFQLRPVKNSQKQLKVLKELINAADVGEVANACDAGREGELIFRRIYAWCGCKKPVKRLWLSEATPAAVREAFKKLRRGEELDNLAAAAEVRAQADWLVGINATRAFTVKHKTLLSVGRVQTPTLALVVQREREIREFRPETYWELQVVFEKNGGAAYRGRWFRDGESRVKERARAEELARAVEAAGSGRVVKVEKRTKSEQPPMLFNLNDLQKEANRRYGLTAQQTLNAAQKLYEESKLITYPRTDSRHLTEALVRDTLQKRLAALEKCPEYGELVRQIRAGVVPGKRHVDDAKVTDHHAIIPTDTIPDLAALGTAERRVYDLVIRRFLAMLYPPAVYDETAVVTEAGGETFGSRGRVERERGWKAVYKEERDEKDGKDEGDAKQPLPPLAEDEAVRVAEAETAERQTKPPKRYTEATLLAAMENAGRFVTDKEAAETLKDAGGIGTPATRAAVIERLIRVGYIERQKKTLVPTRKGETLIDLVPEKVKSVELTAQWEEGLRRIKDGLDDARLWMSGIKNFTREIVQIAKKQEVNSTVRQDRESLGKCPLCGREVVEYPKSYGCSGYREGCRFAIWKQVAGKKISRTQVKALLQKGRTGLIKGFKSKAGKKFDAVLKLSDGKVEFDFGGRGSRGSRKCSGKSGEVT